MTEFDPPIERKEVSVREIVAAVKENGLDHLRGEWIAVFGGKVTGGCVLGQAAVNLSVSAYDEGTKGLYEALNKFPNISEKYSLDADTIQELFDQGWDTDNWEENSGCGATITSYNDLAAVKPNLIPNPNYDPDDHWSEKQLEVPVYYLPTYGAVVEMVEDVLAPYLDEKVLLPVKDYSWNPSL